MRTFEAVGIDPDKPIRKIPKKSCTSSLSGADQGEGREAEPHLRGLVPQIQKSFLSKDVDAMQSQHPRVRGARGHVHDLSRLRRHAAQRGAPARRRRRKDIADVCAMQISDLAGGCAASTSRPLRRCWRSC